MPKDTKLDAALLSAISNVRCEDSRPYSKQEFLVLRRALLEKADTKDLIEFLKSYQKNPKQEEKGKKR